MGRSSIDLYSNDVGAPFPEITSFAAYVGGSPTNISVGGRRLGLRTALLTGLGDDPVGDFVLAFLEREGVETGSSRASPATGRARSCSGSSRRTRFPLVFYRDNCADIELSIEDVLAAPLAEVGVFQFAGTNLSREPSRSATLFAAERAREAGARVVLDLDFRPDQWHDARAFGVAVRSALRLVDVDVGTVDEVNAAVLSDPAEVRVEHGQVSDARVGGDVEAAIARLLVLGPGAVVEKQAPVERGSGSPAPRRSRCRASRSRSGTSSERATRSRRGPLRLREGLGLVRGRAPRQRVRRDRRHEARLRELHADLRRGDVVRGPLRRPVVGGRPEAAPTTRWIYGRSTPAT